MRLRRGRRADRRSGRMAPGIAPAIAWLALALAAGCGGDAAGPVATPEPTALPPATTAPPSGAGELPRIVFLGDSLSAGFGLAEEEAFPALVGEELARRGLAVRVINAGVSGDTTAGGLERLAWLLAQRPRLVVVELGANDGLRGQPVEAIEANLREIVRRSREAGAVVALCGMRMPPSYGRDYASAFEAIYPRLARELELPLLPFLLEGVAARPELNLPDGIHPNPAGHQLVARTVADFLEPLIRELEAGRGVPEAA